MHDDLGHAVDLDTGEQAKTLLDAEEAYGERTVVRVLRTTWTQENDDAFCWFSGCSRCDRELHEGDRGFIWGKPLGRGDRTDHRFVTLQTYCTQECLDEALDEWAAEYGRDLLVGYFEV